MTFREISHGCFGSFSASETAGEALSASAQNRREAVAIAPATSESLSPLHTLATRDDAFAFANPVLRAPAQDPQVLWYRGLYYYCESTAAGIFVRVARHFLDLGSATPRRVWSPSASGGASRNLWAPELHFLDGRCYIYFAADDGRNASHRMWVLAARTSDPAGAYELRGSLETGGWAIDGTVLTDARGQRYFIWSGWPGARNGRQHLYIARMKSPWALAGSRVELAAPEQAWERHAMPICEGPQVLQRGGRTFLVYSASGSWTEHYCLGLLAHDGGDFLDPATWRKAGPVFQKNEHGWGVGHCGFVTAPDGADWLLYHAKTSRKPGWSDREVRAQRFTWRADGTPFFGAPVSLAEKFGRPEAVGSSLAQSA